MIVHGLTSTSHEKMVVKEVGDYHPQKVGDLHDFCLMIFSSSFLYPLRDNKWWFYFEHLYLVLLFLFPVTYNELVLII